MNEYKEIDEVLHYQRLLFVPEIIQTKLISQHYDDLLVRYFGIDKTKDLVNRKYYWTSLWRDIKIYVKDCDICLGSKVVRHKPYGNLQSLLVPTHWWKDFLIDFVMGLPISTNWKRENYDSILVIIDQHMKIVYYKLVKVIIYAWELANVILDVVVLYHGLLNSIVSDRRSLLILKF